VANFESFTRTEVRNTVSLRPAGALFIDRNNSLLLSLHVADIPDYFVHLNVYPNALPRAAAGVGFFTAISREGHWVAGISVAPFPLGFAAGTFP
jgi:hypothetical protein